MTGVILIDDAVSGSALLFEGPREIVRADGPDEVDAALRALEAGLAAGCHAAGFFAYELGYLFEPRIAPLLPEAHAVPLLWFGIYGEPRMLRGDDPVRYLEAESAGDYAVSDMALTMDRDAYRGRFGRVKSFIAGGDIYQLNLTLKARFRFEGDPVSLYRDLRAKQPVGHAALVRAGDFTVLSLSPELFLGLEHGIARTRPMKGTARRGVTLDNDAEVRRWLAADEKSRAENLMIVDLTRNDLGRVAETGSVKVSDLYTVETYSTLHQMTSGVEARLKPGTTVRSLLASLFPPGSVTGAPKLRAMEIIRELEPEARGVYTGAIGWFAPGGRADFNVAIRTLTLDAAGNGEIGIGSGLVQDSEADDEYDECMLKMRFLTDSSRPFELIETLRWEAGRGYILLRHHLARLVRSAAYFEFAHDGDAVRAALQAEAATFTGPGARRVRLLLARDGTISVTSAAMSTADTPAVLHYVYSDIRVDSDDPLLYHKTTLRDLYDGEHARAAAEYGADEVLFLNERGEVTEGSRTNVFVRRGGRLLTPPVAAGLLAGTLRAELLETGAAEEAVLTPLDLEHGDGVLLGNSVRGLVKAEALAIPGERAAAQ